MKTRKPGNEATRRLVFNVKCSKCSLDTPNHNKWLDIQFNMVDPSCSLLYVLLLYYSLVTEESHGLVCCSLVWSQFLLSLRMILVIPMHKVHKLGSLPCSNYLLHVRIAAEFC